MIPVQASETGASREPRLPGSPAMRRGRRHLASYLSRPITRGPGFEPRLPGPEPGVLPLDDPRVMGRGR